MTEPSRVRWTVESAFLLATIVRLRVVRVVLFGLVVLCYALGQRYDVFVLIGAMMLNEMWIISARLHEIQRRIGNKGAE